MKKILIPVITALGIALPGLASAQFMSAAEVRPILDATKGNWVGVRDFNGNDLLYFTHLTTFRCGLSEVRYGLNGEPATIPFPMEECYVNTNTPSAIHPDVHPPYVTLPSGSVQLVTVEIVYDDGSTDSVTFFRNEIVIP